jgi:glycosyltransferase involved in cell wall biosynthesis
MSRITVIFPLYNAESSVPTLVQSIAAQRHPRYSSQSDWLTVTFIDNASADATIRVLEEELAQARLTAPVRIVRNPENLGLARSFNRALGMTDTEFVLTCHADCLFGSDTYVASMLDLLERYPDAAVVTGQPAAGDQLSRVEKVYLTAKRRR